MSFDPLAFFEPITNDSEILLPTLKRRSDESIKAETFKETEAEISTPLQILDLPQPSKQLSYSILKTILKLFQADQIRNFGHNGTNLPSSSNAEELDSFLKQKSLSLDEVKSLAAYMNHSIESVITLSLLPTSNSSLTTAYLTKVISFPFENFTEEQRDEIYDLASHVMTANSAPAMKGNTTRLVQIEGLDKEILLFEPALTEDKVGNITWGASLELAKQIVNNNTSFWLEKSEVPLLELGAGTGLVTIVLRILGYQVISTDLPEILDNLGKNMDLNNLSYTKSSASETIINKSSLHLTSLDWRSPGEFLLRTNCKHGYKCVILSDPVYSPQHPYWVRDTVSAVLSKDPSSRVVFMIGRRDRFQDVRDNMWYLMRSLGLKELYHEITNGFDDYGMLEYDYKVFGW